MGADGRWAWLYLFWRPECLSYTHIALKKPKGALGVGDNLLTVGHPQSVSAGDAGETRAYWRVWDLRLDLKELVGFGSEDNEEESVSMTFHRVIQI